MVSAYGSNGNVGHNMDKEETYRNLVKITLTRRGWDDFIMYDDSSLRSKQLTWLRRMGLMETYDII